LEAAGRTDNEISRKLFIREHTAKSLDTKIINILVANNLTQALSWLLTIGLSVAKNIKN
jgi:DNA-binding CsgD family transcriptional regulator